MVSRCVFIFYAVDAPVSHFFRVRKSQRQKGAHSIPFSIHSRHPASANDHPTNRQQGRCRGALCSRLPPDALRAPLLRKANGSSCLRLPALGGPVTPRWSRKTQPDVHIMQWPPSRVGGTRPSERTYYMTATGGLLLASRELCRWDGSKFALFPPMPHVVDAWAPQARRRARLPPPGARPRARCAANPATRQPAKTRRCAWRRRWRRSAAAWWSPSRRGTCHPATRATSRTCAAAATGRSWRRCPLRTMARPAPRVSPPPPHTGPGSALSRPCTRPLQTPEPGRRPTRRRCSAALPRPRTARTE